MSWLTALVLVALSTVAETTIGIRASVGVTRKASRSRMHLRLSFTLQLMHSKIDKLSDSQIVDVQLCTKCKKYCAAESNKTRRQSQPRFYENPSIDFGTMRKADYDNLLDSQNNTSIVARRAE